MVFPAKKKIGTETFVVGPSLPPFLGFHEFEIAILNYLGGGFTYFYFFLPYVPGEWSDFTNINIFTSYLGNDPILKFIFLNMGWNQYYIDPLRGSVWPFGASLGLVFSCHRSHPASHPPLLPGSSFEQRTKPAVQAWNLERQSSTRRVALGNPRKQWFEFEWWVF